VSFRPAHLLRLGIPAALVAGALVTLTSSSGSAAQPGPYRPPFPSTQQSAKAEFEPNAVVVRFKRKTTTSARQAAVSKVRATTEDSVSSDVVKLKGDIPAQDLLKKVKADPAVEVASLNYRRRIAAVPNDTYYGTGQKTYLDTVRVPQAWDLSKSAGNQIVAVLDTGVDAGHPDLVGHLVPGYNAVSSTRPNPVDDNGHGTMTLGIIAAAANNGAGVAGVGWSAKAMPVKVLGADGSGYDSDVAEGIYWATNNGAKVINLSLGGPGDGAVLHDAVKYAVSKGVVVVAAAGNDGSDVVQFPAAYPEVIAVAATTAGGAKTSFSSFGDWVDVAAPGWDILSTGVRAMTPSGSVPYWYCSGTSCSAPIVAGIAALVKNKWPTFTPGQVQTRLKALARDAGPRGVDPYFGAGIVDAYAALGGKWTTDFPAVPSDGNDQPERAIPVSESISTTIGVEGDVDWFEVTSETLRNLRVSVTGADYNESLYAVNFAPRVEVFDGNLRTQGRAIKAFPDVDPGTGEPQWGPLTASVDLVVGPGSTLIAVRNVNGSRDTRQYRLTITEEYSGPPTLASDYPLRDVLPEDQSTGHPVSTKPSVVFAREVVAGSVTPSTVRLVNAKSGSTVGATVSYDPTTKTAVLTPNVPLTENTPYRIVVSGVEEVNGPLTPPVSSLFSTADLAPPKPAFDASGAYLAANLSWQIPAIPDFDQVIVRRNSGSTVPTLTTGTLVYSGTASAVKNTGLAQGVTYTYAAWLKDRSGKVSPVATTRLLGMKTGISTTSTLINYGGTITLRGSTVRIDNVA
jgi:serine protease